MRIECWLWPDREIGKRLSRVLREEHNAVVNVAAELRDVLELAVSRVELANAEGNPILSAWLPEAKAALAKVTA